jgi:hypothetical protein
VIRTGVIECLPVARHQDAMPWMAALLHDIDHLLPAKSSAEMHIGDNQLNFRIDPKHVQGFGYVIALIDLMTGADQGELDDLACIGIIFDDHDVHTSAPEGISTCLLIIPSRR